MTFILLVQGTFGYIYNHKIDHITFNLIYNTCSLNFVGKRHEGEKLGISVQVLKHTW